MQSLKRSSSVIGVINTHFRSITSNNVAVKSDQDSHIESKPWEEVPGPSTFPMYLYFFFHSWVPSNTDAIAQMYKTYGPIVKIKGILGSPNLTFLFDAEAAAHVLRNENWMPIRTGFESLDYYRKKYNKMSEDPDKPSGLLTDHGELWKKFRSTVNPIMLQPKTIKLYRNSLSDVADDMISRMRLIRNDKNMLEGKFDEEMNLWALESIGVVALGGRLNCLDPNLPVDSPARQLIQTVHDIFKTSEQIDFKPNLWRYISTPLFRKAMRIYDKQAELSKFFIGKAVEQHKKKGKSVGDEKGVLEKLLEIDENTAVIMASDMLFAGVDTAANTVTATLYLLATNQDKQNKLREEILSQSEKRPYLKACIKESLRVMPVVAGNLRVTTREYDILGYKIPKGMYISFAHQFLSSLEEHFPKSKEYIPERWITEKNDPLYYGNAHPFAFNPFGFGARSCIGRRIAELEMEIFVAKIIENFHVEWFGPPLKVKPSTLNYTVAPFNFIFKDVKKM